MAKAERLIPCPRCRKAVIWDTKNPARPFCSRRCQLMDFGMWVGEEHRIPGEPALDEAPPESRSDD